MEIIPPDDDSALHLSGNHHSFEYFASDWHVAGEGTFFIDVAALYSFFGGSEIEAHVLVVPDSWGGLFGEEFLGVEEDGLLLLEGALLLG